MYILIVVVVESVDKWIDRFRMDKPPQVGS